MIVKLISGTKLKEDGVGRLISDGLTGKICRSRAAGQNPHSNRPQESASKRTPRRIRNRFAIRYYILD